MLSLEIHCVYKNKSFVMMTTTTTMTAAAVVTPISMPNKVGTTLMPSVVPSLAILDLQMYMSL